MGSGKKICFSKAPHHCHDKFRNNRRVVSLSLRRGPCDRRNQTARGIYTMRALQMHCCILSPSEKRHCSTLRNDYRSMLPRGQKYTGLCEEMVTAPHFRFGLTLGGQPQSIASLPRREDRGLAEGLHQNAGHHVKVKPITRTASFRRTGAADGRLAHEVDFRTQLERLEL
jgi:hypothetical protein